MTTKEEQATITKYDLLYEQRMTRVETILENMDKFVREGFKEIKSELKEIRQDMKSDYRWLFGIMLVGFLALLGGMGTLFGLMAHGFKWF